MQYGNNDDIADSEQREMRGGMKHDLCLRVTQQYGVHVERDATVTLVEDGFLAAPRFSDVLPEAEWSWLVYAQCSVRWQSVGGDHAWWLQHGSQAWACAVNDVALECGQAVRLHHGDRIELGMLRLQVAAPSGVLNGASRPVEQVTKIELDRPGRPDTAADGAIPADYASAQPFTLSDLADSDSWGQRIGDADPFDLIRSLELPVHDVLNTSTNAVDSAAGAHTGSKRAAPYADDVLDRLAQEYVQTIVDPASLHAQRMAEQRIAVAAAIVETPEQLAATAKEHDTLEDIVSGRLEIAHVLAQLATEDAFSDLSDTSRDDILQLFSGGILPASNRERPPALTRREHHAISPDSHYAPGPTSPASNNNGGVSDAAMTVTPASILESK